MVEYKPLSECIEKMIPVVDCQNDVSSKGAEIFHAIETSGFVFLKNFGISLQLIESVFQVGKKFWCLPETVKLQYARSSNYAKDGNSGYVAQNVEFLNEQSLTEIRESFNINPCDEICQRVEDVVPEFNFYSNKFFNECHGLSICILRIFANYLKLDDENFFTVNHPLNRATTLRLLHYPPLPKNIAPGTVRCGEHSDYGSLTLLFQDSIGGLEVMSRNGSFVPANPVPDTVLVNCGDLIQRWTSNRLPAVKHRVLIPSDQILWDLDRFSLAYFLHPDDEVVVRPLDGSQAYEPVKAADYLIKKFNKTY